MKFKLKLAKSDEDFYLNKSLFSGVSIIIFMLGNRLENDLMLYLGAVLLFVYVCLSIYFITKMWKKRNDDFKSKKMFYFSLGDAIFFSLLLIVLCIVFFGYK